MSVIQSIQNIFGGARIKPAETIESGLRSFSSVDVDEQTDLRRARTSLLQLYRNLELLGGLTNVDIKLKFDLPDAQSVPGLSLVLTETAATLSSVEEINASPMSFTPFGPDWTDGSSALLTIGGEYDGAHGSGNLGFEVRREGTHGVDNLRIRVRDPLNNVVGNYNIQANDPPDFQYDLTNGLYFMLGPGGLTRLDTTSIQVFDNVGAVVDPVKPFDGVRNANPNLQFGLPAIVDGSFSLNGENISVSTTDSINDVIDRINQSSAGVTATFNSLTEQIDFLQDTPGSVPTIDLQGDTSNFLQATKLDTAVVTPGTDAESTLAFEDVAAFSSVQSGNIVINGEQIAIDVMSDSLTSTIDKINASSAGVVASFDAITQKVRISPLNGADSFDIDSNGTGFFAAVNIREGRIDPESVSFGLSRRRSYEVADVLNDVFSELNFLFKDASFLGRGSNAGTYRAPLEEAIRVVFGDESGGEAYGIEFDNTDDARQRGDLAAFDRRDLTRNLQLRGDAVMEFLANSRTGGGLLSNLLEGTIAALKSVNASLGQIGFFVDTFV